MERWRQLDGFGNLQMQKRPARGRSQTRQKFGLDHELCASFSLAGLVASDGDSDRRGYLSYLLSSLPYSRLVSFVLVFSFGHNHPPDFISAQI
jgi:hypothetical protein